MSSPITVDLFVEDRAQEEFLKAMLDRLARDEGKAVTVRIRSARGGHGRALAELSIYQSSLERGVIGTPDMLVVSIDANCQTFNAARNSIEHKIAQLFRDRTVTACPDPHIELWYLADPDSFFKVVGVRPETGRRKCRQDRYRRILSKAVRDAGHPPTLGGIEFAREIVNAMDLYQAGKAQSSLKHFLESATAQIRAR